MYPESRHVIVTCRGGAFPIPILQSSGGRSGGPVPLFNLYTQLAHIMSLPVASGQQDPSVICGLSALHRQTWCAISEKILTTGGEAAESLELMESAILILSMEDCPAPDDLAETLNAVRLGGGNGRFLRFYDKVCD